MSSLDFPSAVLPVTLAMVGSWHFILTIPVR